MKKLDVGATIQVLANVGVLAGIILLAVELRQNNNLLGVELRANSTERILGTATIVLENPYLIELLEKDAGGLTPAERDTLVLLGIRSLSGFESSFREVELGLGDEDVLRRSLRAVWQRPHLNYGMPLAWDTFKTRASPEFRSWMEEHIVNAPSE